MLKHPLKTLFAAAALVIASGGTLAQTGGKSNDKYPPLPPPTPLVSSPAATKLKAPDVTGAPAAAGTAVDATKPEAGAVGTSIPVTSNSSNGKVGQPAHTGTTTGTVNNTTTPGMAMGVSGTVPGAEATSGEASNMRNNPGEKADAKNVDKDPEPKAKP